MEIGQKYLVISGNEFGSRWIGLKFVIVDIITETENEDGEEYDEPNITYEIKLLNGTDRILHKGYIHLIGKEQFRDCKVLINKSHLPKWF